MEKIVIEIIYLSLISVVPKTFSILVPLVGAFWIFKVREQTVAEGKIFELGREIANILQSKEIRGPIDGISYAFIDDARHKINEKNRDKAIKKILQTYLFYNGKENTEKDEQERAGIVVAVATERLQDLVPANVKWSGRGCAYSPFGENIKTEDNYFPFGTKLYRQWIERFGGIYNDLWAITTARGYFIDAFMKKHEDTQIGLDKKFVERWLDDINNRIKTIHPIHAKLLTQLQIIDTQVDLSRLEKDIGLLSFYGFLLLVSGFFAPKIIYSSSLSSLACFLNLTLVTVFLYLLIGLRIVSAVKPVKEKNIQGKIFIPKLHNELKYMEKLCMGYKPYVINNILSMDSDLKLNNKLKSKLITLVEKIETFNEYASLLYKQSVEIIEALKKDFTTNRINQGGFSVTIFELASDDFDIEGIKLRIMKENLNLIFSHAEIHRTRNIFVINLSELNRKKRLDLCERLDYLRESIHSLPIRKTTMMALRELQEARKCSLVQVENIL
jgi:hypothetical protein